MSSSPATRTGKLDLCTALVVRVVLRLILPAGLSPDTVLLWLLHSPALTGGARSLRRQVGAAFAAAETSLFRVAAAGRDVALLLA